MANSSKKPLITLGIVLALAAGGWYAWRAHQASQESGAFLGSNGRIEATEIDVATRLAGRVDKMLVDEGAFVKAGQRLATMQVPTQEAQLREAKAQRQQALHAVASAEAQVAQRQSDKAALVAQVRQAETELDSAKRRQTRSETLAKEGATSTQTLDDDRARTRTAEAALLAAQARATSADAAITASQAQVTSTQSQVKAVDATMERIQADIDDSQLKDPRDGRVQFRVAQPGEVVAGGGRVLNMIDLTDVSMTFFLPTEHAGRLAMGSEVRIVLDAAPQLVIPATVSFIASNAQFTPKTVETASERQKLMFRVRARIAPELLRGHLEQVKTGLPGEAWIRLDTSREWPQHLTPKVR